MPAVLAVDLGKSGCRAALWLAPEQDPAGKPARSADGPGAPGLAADGGLAAAEQVIISVCNEILADAGHPAVGALCVGAAGALAAPDAVRTLAGWLSARIPTGGVVVCSDALTGHAGALGGRPGLVLTAGTGAVVVGLGPAGLVQVDGWGPLLGDAGSGGWIGIAGLRAALRSHDGRGPRTALEQAATDQYGELTGLAGQFGGRANPAQTAAAFVPTVAKLAESGDPVAAQILRDAAAELAESVLTAARRLGLSQPEIAITGGLVDLGPALLTPLRQRVQAAEPALRLQPAAGSALDGARLLALRADTVAEPYLHRIRTAAPAKE